MKYYKINQGNLLDSGLGMAAEAVRQGRLVAFPTETVYGLGADALNSSASLKIYRAKGRPLTNPLIVHVAGTDELLRIAKEIPDDAIKLTDRFWPGPLTLILKRSEIIPDIVSGGLKTVAVRMPENTVALELIRRSGTPVAAPSANIYGKPSPTSAQHVIEDFGDKIEVVLDGGDTDIGIESTIIDMTVSPYEILRPGGITQKELREVLSEVKNYGSKNKIIRSSGMMPKHYSPEAELILFEERKNRVNAMRKKAETCRREGISVGILATNENKENFSGFKIKELGSGSDYKSCALNLYRLLRDFDRENTDIILAEGIKREGLGTAVMDRLQRAAD